MMGITNTVWHFLYVCSLFEVCAKKYMEGYRSLWKCMGVYGSVWKCMKMHGSVCAWKRVRMEVQGSVWK
jgi:hypothetical protein